MNAHCCNCGAVISVRRYFDAGWIRAALDMVDGTQQRHYLCDKCRHGLFNLFAHAGEVTAGRVACPNNPPQARKETK